MSLELPSKSEVLGWSAHQLAEFLKRMDLGGSDKIVLKNMISGSRFLNMTDNDLQRFPKIHAPLISKLCSEINKKEERRSLFGKRSTGPRYPEAVGHHRASADHQAENHGFCDPQQAGWGEDEFEDSDDDYEDPDGDEPDGEAGSGGDYESPEDGAFADDNDYEPPPSEPPDDLAHKLCPSVPLPDGDYIDKPRPPSHVLPPMVTPRPAGPALASSTRPAVEPSPEERKAPPKVFRDKKPTRVQTAPLTGLGQQFNQGERVRQQSWRPPVSPAPPSVSRSNSSVMTPPSFLLPVARNETQQEDTPPKHHTFPLPAAHNKELPPRPGLAGLPGTPPRHADSLPPSLPADGSLPQRLRSVMGVQRSRSSAGDRPLPLPSAPTSLPTLTAEPHSTQELDRSWYVGKVTRGQAESCLKQVDKDGAYVVRDSSKQPDVQPYTLMVLYQNKVFNIQIRRHGAQYLLGTGLKVHETFPAVSDIISHYSQSPLLLINAKSRGSGQHNMCRLTEPAGHCVTVNTWN